MNTLDKIIVPVPPGQNQCRCRIVGTFKGRPFEYVDPEGSDGSQFIHGEDNGEADPSYFWWSEGNMSCDCNRQAFIPEAWQAEISGCGETILINRIEPLVPGWPVLELNESTEGRL